MNTNNSTSSKKLLGILLFLFCFVCAVNAQSQKRIAGMVVDESNQPLVGATVVELGASNGTVTDFDGKFILNVSQNTKQLQAS